MRERKGKVALQAVLLDRGGRDFLVVCGGAGGGSSRAPCTPLPPPPPSPPPGGGGPRPPPRPPPPPVTPTQVERATEPRPGTRDPVRLLHVDTACAHREIVEDARC